MEHKQHGSQGGIDAQSRQQHTHVDATESEADATPSEIEALLHEEAAVAAAGAAATVSAEALSALDLFVGSSGQVHTNAGHHTILHRVAAVSKHYMTQQTSHGL